MTTRIASRLLQPIPLLPLDRAHWRCECLPEPHERSCVIACAGE